MGILNRLLGRDKSGAATRLSSHCALVSSWEDIYRGGGDWRYTRKGGINGGSRRVASLGAAKALCAELSRLCFSEGAQVCSADPQTEQFLRGVLEQNRFTERFPAFLESVMALGGGAVKVYWDGGIKLDFITAESFIPTHWDTRSITGAAFASKITENGKGYILAESQHMDGGDLVVENRLFSESGAEAKLSELFPALPERSVIKGIEKPLFVYFSADRGSNSECPLLGASVFAGATDTLRAIDTVFDSLHREFILGKKRIIVPSYAIRGEYDENGDIRRYFDVNDEVFQAMSVSDTEELKFTDNTAELRVEEHTSALAALIDLLCMQAGLSEGALSYKDGSIRTATEVVSRNSKTYRTQAHLRGVVSAGVSQVLELVCILGKMCGELSDSAAETASVMFADGAAEDDSARCDRALKLYNAGVISKARALSQIYKISLEEAEQMERTDNHEN